MSGRTGLHGAPSHAWLPRMRRRSDDTSPPEVASPSPPPAGGGAVTATIDVGGDFTGLAAVGNSIVQMQVTGHGNLVVVQPEPPKVAMRATPVRAAGRPPRVFVDRVSERALASRCAQSRETLAINAAVGSGKTTLLHRLAVDLVASGPLVDSSLILLDVRGRPVREVLLEVFGLVYDVDRPYLPEDAALRRHLAAFDGLVLVDDADFVPDDFQHLLDMLPAAGVLVTCAQPLPLALARPLALGPLPPEQAVELARALAGAAPDDSASTVAAAVRTGLPGAVSLAARLRADAEPQAGTAAPIVLPAGPDRALLELLAVVPAAGMTAARAAAALHEPTAAVAEQLRSLAERGAVEVHADEEVTFTAAGLVAAALTGNPREAERRAALVASFAVAPGLFTRADADTAYALLGAAEAEERWHDVTTLTSIAEPLLAREGRWDRWGRTLALALAAAVALEDRRAEAWALHQQGTLALCLGRQREARALLSAALQLREGMADEEGARVTRHNLRLLGVGPPVEPPRRRGMRVGRRGAFVAAGTAAVVATGVAAGVGAVPGPWHHGRVASGPSASGAGGSGGQTGQVVLAAPNVVRLAPVSIGSPVEAAVEIQNRGRRTMNSLTTRTTGRDAERFVVLDSTCRSVRASGGCRVRVQFVPVRIGPATAQLVLTSIPSGSGAGSRATVQLTGTGLAAPPGSLQATPAALAFGDQPVGRPAVERLTITPSAPALRVTVEGSGAGDFSTETPSCSPNRCTLVVHFLPTASGPRQASLVVTDASSGRSVAVPLTGTGTRPVTGGQDTTPPRVFATRSFSPVEAASKSGARITSYGIRAVDDVDGVINPVCTPPAPVTLPLGVHTITCTATDKAGNTAPPHSFPLTVQDTTGPAIAPLQDLIVPARSAKGAYVSLRLVSGTDAVDGRVTAQCTPGSEVFPLGRTTVSCVAIDSRGNSSLPRTFTVTVVDKTPPVISQSGDRAFTATEVGTSDYGPSARDNVDSPPTVTCDPAKITAPDNQKVTCWATDAAGNRSPSVHFSVSVSAPIG